MKLMRRIAVALEMWRVPQDRAYALKFLFGRAPLSAWEQKLLLAAHRPLVPGPRSVSGVRDEGECPGYHAALTPGRACHWCKAQI